MDKQYMHSLVEIVDVLNYLEIVGLSNKEDEFKIITKEHDITVENKLDNICDKIGLEWDFKPTCIQKSSRRKHHTYKDNLPGVEYFFNPTGDV